MKHLKMLGLAAVAAMALMAVVGAATASATALYNGGTKMGFGSTFDFSLKPGTTSNLTDTEGEALDTCSSSTLRARITNPGGENFGVFGEIEEVTDVGGKVTYPGLTWGSCTFPTSTVALGLLEILHIKGTTNATVRASLETAWTINTIFFGSCVYGMNGAMHIGVITTASSGDATLHVNATVTKRSGSGFACPETAKWVATYTGTEPTNLRAEAS